jgi:phosphate transport system protein
MGTHFERTFEKDLDHIRQRLTKMAGLGERALRTCLRALQERNRQLAYGVILGDRGIDEMEREIDQLCLEFLVRQQPVARPLRFAYSTIRINLELERIGDYAESIARQIIKLLSMGVEFPLPRFNEIANLAIPMLHDAVRAFVTEDEALARRSIQIEEAVDVLRNTINTELYQLRQEEKIPLQALTPLMTIARRFERVSDQAKNICQEVLYCATGEHVRHAVDGHFRVLFLGENDACRTQIASAVANGMKQPKFVFSSAGLEPRPVDPRTTAFLASKGLAGLASTPRALDPAENLDRFDVVIGLSKGVQRVLPPPPRKTVFLDWSLPNPAEAGGSDAEKKAAYERAAEEIRSHLRDLVGAILGEDVA